MTSEEARFPSLLWSERSQRILEMCIPLLSSSIHRRICPALYLVGAAWSTIVRECCTTGLRDPRGTLFATVAAVLVGVLGGGDGDCLEAAFGPKVGCLPLSFFVGAASGGGVVEVAASA